jgi:hypothetical protein
MKDKIATLGFDVLPEVISESEINAVIKLTSDADISSPVFRKSNDLFAIRLPD